MLEKSICFSLLSTALEMSKEPNWYIGFDKLEAAPPGWAQWGDPLEDKLSLSESVGNRLNLSQWT